MPSLSRFHFHEQVVERNEIFLRRHMPFNAEEIPDLCAVLAPTRTRRRHCELYYPELYDPNVGSVVVLTPYPWST